MPVIAKVQEPWRVFLVDNPGFSADDDGINSLAQTAMETSHAYILTLDYNTIEDKTNAKTFQDIFKKDKSRSGSLINICIYYAQKHALICNIIDKCITNSNCNTGAWNFHINVRSFQNVTARV